MARRRRSSMKIHRVVQMLGATTSTGKLASDMYDLGHKDYYSKAEDRYIPISHMDFQHMVRAFVKQNDEAERCMKERNFLQEENENLEKQLGSSHRAYKMGFERNGRHIEEVKKLELENQRLVQQLEHDETVVSKEAYQVMWDNCDVWKERYQNEVNNAEYWKAQYRIANDLLQPNKGCGYVFSEIPNDTDGQEFVDTMKKYLNKDSYKMRVRGQHIKPELRGTGATYFGQNLNESTHMRIYIDKKKGE
jgi:regulator of replication initiation timing